MKVWKTYYHDPSEGKVLAWSSANATAKKLLANARKECDTSGGPQGVEMVEVPTDKMGLIRWLNANATRDNG